MKSVIDNVAIHAIQCCLLAGASDPLSPSHVLQMDHELVCGHQNQALREQTQRKLMCFKQGRTSARCMVTASFHRTEVSKSRFTGSQRLLKWHDPKECGTSFDAERPYEVRCRVSSVIAVTDRQHQETAEIASAELPESIKISSELDIVPPSDIVQLAFELASSSPSNTVSTVLFHPTGWSRTPASTQTKKGI